MKRRPGAPDLGIADKHTLAMLQIALILLVVPLTAMLAVWALSAPDAG